MQRLHTFFTFPKVLTSSIYNMHLTLLSTIEYSQSLTNSHLHIQNVVVLLNFKGNDIVHPLQTNHFMLGSLANHNAQIIAFYLFISIVQQTLHQRINNLDFTCQPNTQGNHKCNFTLPCCQHILENFL